MPNQVGRFFGMLSQKQKEQVLKDVAVEAKSLFDTYRKAIKEGTGLKEPGTLEKLQQYRARPPEAWASIRQKFPEEYERMQKEWLRLEGTAMRKEAAKRHTPDQSILQSPEAQFSQIAPRPREII